MRSYVTRRALFLVAFLAFTLSLSAQPQPSTDAPQPSSAENDKQRKPDVRPGDAADADTFDERAAAQVLGTIRDGLEGHSQRLFLAAFDRDKMNGFLTFQDQIEAYFTRYESFRLHLRIIQTSMENNRGAILAEFQVESEPRGGGRMSRREGQLRFELERGAKGWKIVDLNPRGFFS